MFLVLGNPPFLQGVVFRLRDLSRKHTLYPQNFKTLFYVHFSFSYFQVRRGDTGFPLIVIYKGFTLFFNNFYLFIYLFIYGCIASSFLCEGFL